MNDRAVRNLAHLEDSASTARVLNLLRVFRRRRGDPAYAQDPFFKNPTLNKALIIKHRLRRHERDLFFDGRATATKVIVPIDGQDLKLGGRSVFVDQINYDMIMETVFGDTWMADAADRELLRIIDKLPSLDPFLLREQLKRHGRSPARCYFDISEADMTRMRRFVEHEIQKLIDLCFKGNAPQSSSDQRQTSRLVEKILSSTVDADTEPLRLTLKLERRDYQEGVFCWKGFLYYKWMLAELMPSVTRVTEELMKARPRGSMDSETVAYLGKARESLRDSIEGATTAARKTLRFYDSAFASLIDGKPTAFREFLLSAPAMFCELGERLGAVSHVVSFWNYRFPQGKLPVMSGVELVDIFSDFEESLAFVSSTPRPKAPASHAA
ncbi:MAG TPA: hypothetical protein VGL58_18600 [Caulobacteraceae bacterium]